MPANDAVKTAAFYFMNFIGTRRTAVNFAR